MKVKRCQGGRLTFYCPGCEEHHVITVEGGGSWKWNGSFESPTIEPSVLVRNGHYVPNHEGECWCTYDWKGQEPAFKCSQCHSFIKDGRIQFLDDCTHGLAKQTVDLPELESKPEFP
jgi:Zn finger protein HypA/HybF involved in hydrogenase expression